MGPRRRQPGERRWGIPVEFPLTDNEGLVVVRDRRSGMDRRKAIASLEELLILFAQGPLGDPEANK